MTVTLHPTFAASLRRALVDQVAGDGGGRTRRRRRRILGASLGVALIGTGSAVASTIWSAPGADKVTELSPTISVTRSGTSLVRLGRAPGAATNVELRLTCLSAGSFHFSDGASLSCTAASLGTAEYTMRLHRGQNAILISTDHPSSRWRLTAAYSQHTPTRWDVNAHGQTYGVQHSNGAMPDLVQAIATNGRIGYVYSNQLSAAANRAQTPNQQNQQGARARPINVYLSDGTTVVGVFVLEGPTTAQ